MDTGGAAPPTVMAQPLRPTLRFSCYARGCLFRKDGFVCFWFLLISTNDGRRRWVAGLRLTDGG